MTLLEATISSITGDFIGNSVFSEAHQALAGAIHNSGTIVNITGSFIGNYANGQTTTYGGVRESNAIHIASARAILNLNSINSGTIIFNDGINGTTGYKISLTGDASSKIIFNEHIKNANIAQSGDVMTTVTKAEYLSTNNSLTITSGTFLIFLI